MAPPAHTSFVNAIELVPESCRDWCRETTISFAACWSFAPDLRRDAIVGALQFQSSLLTRRSRRLRRTSLAGSCVSAITTPHSSLRRGSSSEQCREFFFVASPSAARLDDGVQRRICCPTPNANCTRLLPTINALACIVASDSRLTCHERRESRPPGPTFARKMTASRELRRASRRSDRDKTATD